MKRGDITTVNKLSPGDRFHKLGSKDRKVFQFISPEAHGKFEVCSSDKTVSGFPINKSSIQIFKGETVVVFLRNINDK